MNKAFIVAKWEYLEKIKSRAFLISLVLTPGIMVLFTVLPAMFAGKQDTETKVIGVIDQSGAIVRPLAGIVEERFRLAQGQPNYIIRPIAPDPDLKHARMVADSLVLAKTMEGYFIIPPTIFTDTTIQYRAENVGNFRIPERFSSVVHDIVLRAKLSRRGIDSSAINDLTGRLDVRTFKVVGAGEKDEEGGFERIFMVAYAFMMMMFFVVITSGQLLVRSMLEEKSNRIVEVLVSSCSTTELMAGKILGLSGLGLTQIGLWGILALGFAGPVVASIFTPVTAILFLVYFVLGYLFYASVFVALGAPLSTEQEAQQLTGYLVMILLLPAAFVIPVVQNPDSILARTLSFVPLLTPTMMAMRMAVRVPNAWEIVATVVLLAVSAYGMIRAAGKIFRTTILLTGKRPGLKELIAILRTS